jgi:hypothetical protein
MVHFDEAQARTIDTICKIATAFALVVGGSFTAYSYVTNRTAQTKSAVIEAKKPYLERRLEFYLDTTTTVATIATGNADQVSKAKEHFSQLFWGPLGVVATPDVSYQMTVINECLEAGRNCTNAKLKALVQELGRLCGNSMAAEWGAFPPNSPSNLVIKMN